ncbi:MAG: Ig-like domain-containing protein, partial [Gemmatimonadaceae bacterium]
VTPTDVLFSSIGETAPLSVKIVPVAGASVAGLVVNFSSNSTGVVAVDPKGVMTSIGNGVAKVTAELDGLTASVNVTVQQATSSIAVAPRAVSVSSVGATQSFSVTILDAKGQPIVNPTVVWSSSDPTVAQVTGSGSSATATAKKAGSASIIATADGKVDAATFIVAPVVKLLAVVSDKAQILTGGTANLTAYLADANGNPVSQTTATFTSTTPNVASVAGNVVTGLAPGVARIMGTSGGLTGFVNIMITSPSGGGNGLVIGPATAEKIPGGTQQFSVTSGGQGPFTWTVNGIPGGNATFGTIDGQGFYTAPNAVPSPASFDVCANQASPSANGCATVTINPIPTSGGEVIVFNDDNMFDNSYGAPYAGNIQLFKNLVDFTAAGPRAAQTGVLFFHGHDSGCGGYIDSECLSGSYSTFYATIQSIGYTVSEVNDVTASITSIAPTIKVIFLMMPEQTFSVSEINILKAFAADGGRIVYVGERTPFLDYNGLQGTAVENQFLSDMGAVMRNIGGDYSCPGIMDAAHIRPHQVTTGVTSISMACVSAVQLGPNDYALVYDETTPGVVLAAVAKVDLTPISGPPPQSSDRRARPTRAAPAASPDMIEHGWGRGPRPTAQPPAKVRPPD